MPKKHTRLLLTVLGALLGAGLVRELLSFMVEIQLLTPDHASVYPWISLLAYVLGVGIFAVLSYFFSLPCSMAFIRLMRWIEGKLSKVPMIDMIFGCAGLLVGLLIAFLITFVFLSGIRRGWPRSSASPSTSCSGTWAPPSASSAGAS